MDQHEVPSRQLLDFTKADVISPRIEPPRPVLVVAGVKPNPVMKVVLAPLAYAKVPAFWQIQVVGLHPGKGEPTQLPADTPTEFRVEIDLDGVTGTIGVDVIGATHNQKIQVTTDKT